jgi:hypothetical protein
MAASKKRVIKSLDNLGEDLKELIREQYPTGYEGSITRIVTPKKEQIFVFPLETADAVYLIKVPVTKNSDGEYDVESAEKGEFGEDTSGGGGKSRGKGGDDDFDNNDDDFDSERNNDEEDDNYDEEGGGKRNREQSYDPDFDG